MALRLRFLCLGLSFLHLFFDSEVHIIIIVLCVCISPLSDPDSPLEVPQGDLFLDKLIFSLV